MNKGKLFSKIVVVIFFLSILILTGCYSFTGGSVPEHLESIQIMPVVDNSGYGNPLFREELQNNLVEKFITDGSFSVAENNGDARLTASIASIRDQTIALSQGELETERKIVVTVKAEYFDAIERKQIFTRRFNNEQLYALSNPVLERNEAVIRALDQLSDDIRLAVVSGW
ncbi:MAG: LptE family protein [Candidatus Kapaibacteriales bacterium]